MHRVHYCVTHYRSDIRIELFIWLIQIRFIPFRGANKKNYDCAIDFYFSFINALKFVMDSRINEV